jgi:hypothetical protein
VINNIPLARTDKSHHQSKYGYFLLEADGWSFIAFEKSLKEEDLVAVLETLRDLNRETK